MVAKHISMRGEVVDMERLRLANGDQVALGNAQKNARGDTLGPGGVVLRTQEQIEAEWNANKAKVEASTKTVDIKSDDALAKALAALAPKPTANKMQDADFDPDAEVEESAPVQPTKAGNSRRRVIESD